MILAWRGPEASRGQASDWHTDWNTHGYTHTQTQATTIPEGQNWPRVKIWHLTQCRLWNTEVSSIAFQGGIKLIMPLKSTIEYHKLIEAIPIFHTTATTFKHMVWLLTETVRLRPLSTATVRLSGDGSPLPLSIKTMSCQWWTVATWGSRPPWQIAIFSL